MQLIYQEYLHNTTNSWSYCFKKRHCSNRNAICSSSLVLCLIKKKQQQQKQLSQSIICKKETEKRHPKNTRNYHCIVLQNVQACYKCHLIALKMTAWTQRNVALNEVIYVFNVRKCDWVWKLNTHRENISQHWRTGDYKWKDKPREISHERKSRDQWYCYNLQTNVQHLRNIKYGVHIDLIVGRYESNAYRCYTSWNKGTWKPCYKWIHKQLIHHKAKTWKQTINQEFQILLFCFLASLKMFSKW